MFVPFAIIAIFLCSFSNILINKSYNIPWVKFFTTILLSWGCCLLSARVWHFIESGDFNQNSFFGVVFLLPLFEMLLSKILKIETWKMTNICTLLTSITYAVSKISCTINNCCIGKMITMPNGLQRIFPSSKVECAFGFILFFMFLILILKYKNSKILYPIFMIVYGVGRFILNSFRLEEPIFSFFRIGHIWSVCSIVIGIISIILIINFNKNHLQKNISLQEGK